MKKGAEVLKEEINLVSALTIPLPQPFMATFFEAVEQLPAGKYKFVGIWRSTYKFTVFLVNARLAII